MITTIMQKDKNMSQYYLYYLSSRFSSFFLLFLLDSLVLDFRIRKSKSEMTLVYKPFLSSFPSLFLYYSNTSSRQESPQEMPGKSRLAISRYIYSISSNQGRYCLQISLNYVNSWLASIRLASIQFDISMVCNEATEVLAKDGNQQELRQGQRKGQRMGKDCQILAIWS